MKEWAASIIVIMFTGAIIYLTIIGKVPVEAFLTIAAGALVWVFKQKEITALLKRLKDKEEAP